MRLPSVRKAGKKWQSAAAFAFLLLTFGLGEPRSAFAQIPVSDPIEQTISTAIKTLEQSDFGQMIMGLGNIFNGISDLTSKLEDDLGITALVQSLSARVQTMAQLQAQQAAIDNARLTAEAAEAARIAAENAISVSAAQKYCNEMMARKAMSYGEIMENAFAKMFSAVGNNVDRLPGTNGNSPAAAGGALVPAGCASFMGNGTYRGLPFQVNCNTGSAPGP